MKLSLESMQVLFDEYHLTAREVEIIRLLLLRVVTVDALAARMGLTPGTVRQYLRVLYAKFHVNSKIEILVELADRGLLNKPK